MAVVVNVAVTVFLPWLTELLDRPSGCPTGNHIVSAAAAGIVGREAYPDADFRVRDYPHAEIRVVPERGGAAREAGSGRLSGAGDGAVGYATRIGARP
jgi:hypothetical protein